jgi:hypothetical protein
MADIQSSGGSGLLDMFSNSGLASSGADLWNGIKNLPSSIGEYTKENPYMVDFMKTAIPAGLDYMGKTEALDFNKGLAAQNAAWQQKLLDLQLGNQASEEAYRDATNSSFATGFNKAFGYPDKNKKPTTALGTPVTGLAAMSQG